MQAQAHFDSSYSWARLGISILIATIGNVGMWAVVVVLPAVQAEFGVERGDASLAYTMTMVGFAVGNVLFGRYIDRRGIAVPVAIASVANGAGFILAGMAQSIWLFALVQGVLIGIGTAINFGPLLADVSHWFWKRRGLAVAAAASGNYLAGAVWPPVMNYFLADAGWRATYIGIGIFIVATIVPLSLLLRRPRPAETMQADGTTNGPPLKQIAMSKNALLALLFVSGVGCCVAMAMPQVHIVAYCVDLGYGVARGSEMLSIMLAAGIVSRLASGVLADKIGGIATVLVGSVGQALSLLLFIPFDGLVSLYVVSLVFGLVQGGIVPGYAIIVREYLPAKVAGERVGIVIMATIIGMALGGWMSGFIYDLTGSYAAAFINGIGWNLLNIAAILLIVLKTRGRKRLAAVAA
ncbi:MFS transporter [Mesorhizobium sp. Z1-4]|uniref:MFS transporter n=1 Tax=Mesorhizobium sp. Z1-4 TaxID=2448478 RepID=UPI001FDF2A35|nr:MFS transporter [Mesorhizobium sp. Z1-4]